MPQAAPKGPEGSGDRPARSRAPATGTGAGGVARRPPAPGSVGLAADGYLMAKYQDFARTFLAASVATILTVFLPRTTFGELYTRASVEAP